MNLICSLTVHASRRWNAAIKLKWVVYEKISISCRTKHNEYQSPTPLYNEQYGEHWAPSSAPRTGESRTLACQPEIVVLKWLMRMTTFSISRRRHTCNVKAVLPGSLGGGVGARCLLASEDSSCFASLCIGKTNKTCQFSALWGLHGFALNV